MSATTILAQAAHGLVHTRHLYYDLVGLPFAALGIGSGTVVYNRFDTQGFADIVVSSLLIMGLVFIYTATAELSGKHGSLGSAVYTMMDRVSNSTKGAMTRSAGSER